MPDAIQASSVYKVRETVALHALYRITCIRWLHATAIQHISFNTIGVTNTECDDTSFDRDRSGNGERV